jgi:hypothetical protein
MKALNWKCFLQTTASSGLGTSIKLITTQT